MKNSLVLLALLAPLPLSADPLLSPADFIIPIDEDFAGTTAASSYPAGEEPLRCIDGDVNTKYLNFGEGGSGFIVTPAAALAVQSLQITTANDSENRDPTSFILSGTNDVIDTPENSQGGTETWTEIATGALMPSINRFEAAPVVSFINTDAYTSYRLVFPTVRDAGGANSMQVAEVQFYTEADGGGSAVLAPANPIVAIDLPVAGAATQSESPGGEQAPLVIDGDIATKYLNFGKTNSGFIVTPAGGVSVVTGFTMTTANDATERDPVNWELYGTNDTITTVAHGTGLMAESWALISSGTLAPPAGRGVAAPAMTFANADGYTSYKWLVRSLIDEGLANSMQIAEIQFDGRFGNGTPLVITDIIYDQGNDQFTVSWSSEPGQFYSLFYSPDAIDWSVDIDDSIPADAVNPITTLSLIDNPTSGASRGFFRVQRN